jgi:hypothetical protein
MSSDVDSSADIGGGLCRAGAPPCRCAFGDNFVFCSSCGPAVRAGVCVPLLSCEVSTMARIRTFEFTSSLRWGDI